MKRSTKRVVGWGIGVSVGIVLVLLTVVIILAVNSTPIERVDDQHMAHVDHVGDHVHVEGDVLTH